MIKNKESDIKKTINRPAISKNLFSDFKYFLINKPVCRTYIEIESDEKREEFTKRIP